MRLRHVGKGHYAVCEQDGFPSSSPRLPRWAYRFWVENGLGHADSGVVATHGGVLVGFFRFTLVNRLIVAAGTWVAVPFRRRGLAQRMWHMALQRHRPPRGVEVVVATDAGDRFVKSLQRRWSPRVGFKVFAN